MIPVLHRILAVIGDDVYRFFFLVDTGNHSDGTVYPPAVEIILIKMI